MNLMSKCVQIKDELGQLYTYLLKTIRLPYLQVKFYSMALYCLFSLAGEAAYVALPLM
jgi:hypothetical protein